MKRSRRDEEAVSREQNALSIGSCPCVWVLLAVFHLAIQATHVTLQPKNADIVKRPQQSFAVRVQTNIFCAHKLHEDVVVAVEVQGGLTDLNKR